LTVLFYFSYGFFYSVGNNGGWDEYLWGGKGDQYEGYRIDEEKCLSRDKESRGTSGSSSNSDEMDCEEDAPDEAQLSY